MRVPRLAWALCAGAAAVGLVVWSLAPSGDRDSGADIALHGDAMGGGGPELAVTGSAPHRFAKTAVLPQDVGLKDLLWALADRAFAAQATERLQRLEDPRAAAETLIEWMRTKYDEQRTVPGSGPMYGVYVLWIQRALVLLGEPAVGALRDALLDAEGELRFRVVVALSFFFAGAAPAVPELLARVHDGAEDKYTRARAIYVVVGTGEPAPELLRMVHAFLRDEDTPEVITGAAAFALFRLGAPDVETFETARRALERHGLADGREILASIESLGSRAEAMVPFLVRLLDELQPDGPLRLQAIGVLGKIANDDPRVISRLLTMVREDEDGLGAESAYALVKTGPKGRDTLRKEISLTTGPERAVLLRALVHGMADFERESPLTPEAVVIMVEASAESDRQIRTQVALALERTPPGSEPVAFDALVRLSQDGDNEVRLFAWRGLSVVGRGREAELVEGATKALDDEEEWPIAVIEVLGRAGRAAEASIPAIEKAAGRWKDARVGQASAQAIARIRASVAASGAAAPR